MLLQRLPKVQLSIHSVSYDQMNQTNRQKKKRFYKNLIIEFIQHQCLVFPRSFDTTNENQTHTQAQIV